MSYYTVTNILDLMDAIGEDELRSILSDFSCPKNKEIENFVQRNAIEIVSTALSSSLKKKLLRYAQLDEETGSLTLSTFLIGQFGKNYQYQNVAGPDGKQLMEAAFGILKHVQREIGGGIVYLECEDKPQLLGFYQNDANHFRIFGERYSKLEGTKYIQLLKLI